MEDSRNRAIGLMQRQQFAEARFLFEDLIENSPDDGSLEYMAGQCCRFQGELQPALSHLKRAAELQPNQKEVFLAMGIALQLSGRLDDAKNALARCLELDSEFLPALNSLALIQKSIGEYDKAIHNFELALRILAKKIVTEMENRRESPIFKTALDGSELWAESACFGALYLCSATGGVDSIAWPTGAQAEEEERTERHGGLYWVDREAQNGKTVRCFLPNYFNTFRECLNRNPLYATLVGNKGTVHELMGDFEESNKCYAEAEAFAH